VAVANYYSNALSFSNNRVLAFGYYRTLVNRWKGKRGDAMIVEALDIYG